MPRRSTLALDMRRLVIELRSRFWIGICASAVIAAVGFWVGPGRWLAYGGGNSLPDPETLRLCTYLAVAWLLVFLGAVPVYRLRSLWLLPLAPVATFWPVMFLLNGLRLSELFNV